VEESRGRQSEAAEVEASPRRPAGKTVARGGALEDQVMEDVITGALVGAVTGAIAGAGSGGALANAHRGGFAGTLSGAAGGAAAGAAGGAVAGAGISAVRPDVATAGLGAAGVGAASGVAAALSMGSAPRPPPLLEPQFPEPPRALAPLTVPVAPPEEVAPAAAQPEMAQPEAEEARAAKEPEDPQAAAPAPGRALPPPAGRLGRAQHGFLEGLRAAQVRSSAQIEASSAEVIARARARLRSLYSSVENMQITSEDMLAEESGHRRPANGSGSVAGEPSQADGNRTNSLSADGL